MTTVEKIGVIGGGDDDGRLNGVIHGGARAANSAHSVRAAGALPITLGPLVLRSETAAIYCLSVINYELHSQRDQTDRSGQ